jgi:DNA-binding protein YbaB
MGSLSRFQQQAAQISASAESPDQLVGVTVSGTGDITVDLRAGALRDTTEKELAAKITRTLGDAMWELRTEYQATSRQILGTD